MTLYLIKFIACSAFFMLLFHLFMAKEKTFELNRWVLVFLIPAAMVVPFFTLPVFLPQENPIQVTYLQLVQSQPVQLIATTPTPSPHAHSPIFWLVSVYLIVSLVLLAKKLSALSKLIHWTKREAIRSINGARLILSEKVQSPFSFGKFIFMHPSVYKEGNEKTEMILKHEFVHIAQRHHLDLAVMEFISVLCWFNPVVYMVKKAVVLNHEYLADQGVKDVVHPVEYKKLLLNLTLKNNALLMTSAISSSTLKQRLVMLNKLNNNTTMRLKTFYFSLLTLLVVAGFIFPINAEKPYKVLSAQKQAPSIENQNMPLTKNPEFKGGMEAFSSYVKSEAKYPLHARMEGKEGQVLIQFIVEKDGSLSNVMAAAGSEDGFMFLAERIIKNAPAFHPGMQNGRPVRVQLTIPLFFTLSDIILDVDKLPKGEVSIGEMTSNKDGLKVNANYGNGNWKGTVRDPEGNVLPGAMIRVEGTNIGTVTDIDGEFVLKTDSSATLVIGFIGYKDLKLKHN